MGKQNDEAGRQKYEEAKATLAAVHPTAENSKSINVNPNSIGNGDGGWSCNLHKFESGMQYITYLCAHSNFDQIPYL